MVTYLVNFLDGPCSGVRSIAAIPHFWFLKAGDLWYYYRLQGKLNRIQSEEEVAANKKINTVKKYNPYSRAKNRHGGRIHLPIQATYVYVPGCTQDMEENHCDVVTFRAWYLREFGVEYTGE